MGQRFARDYHSGPTAEPNVWRRGVIERHGAILGRSKPRMSETTSHQLVLVFRRRLHTNIGEKDYHILGL